MRKNNFSSGDRAEHLAKQFLIDHGFSILEHNVRVKNHEVDIISVDQELNELVFVEVKSRATGYYGDPCQAVDYSKLRSIQYVAAYYRRQINYQGDFRFDIITVVDGTIQHYQNVTWNR